MSQSYTEIRLSESRETKSIKGGLQRAVRFQHFLLCLFPSIWKFIYTQAVSNIILYGNRQVKPMPVGFLIEIMMCPLGLVL